MEKVEQALSEHAKEQLRSLARKPVPRQELNPGVAGKLVRDGLAAEVQLPSPYKVHKGKTIAFLEATKEGRDAVGLK